MFDNGCCGGELLELRKTGLDHREGPLAAKALGSAAYALPIRPIVLRSNNGSSLVE